MMPVGQSPNLIAMTSAVNPVVHIHVEKDGRVPPESVHLTFSPPATRPTTIRRWPRRRVLATCMNPCRMAVHLIFPSPLNQIANVKLYFPPSALAFLVVILACLGTQVYSQVDRSRPHPAPRGRFDQWAARGRRDGNRQRRSQAHRDDFARRQRIGGLSGHRRRQRRRV